MYEKDNFSPSNVNCLITDKKALLNEI